MRFREIMGDVETVSIVGDADIRSVAYDSRKVRPGCLFVAMRGESSDGNRFIDAALRAGAVAMVSDDAQLTAPAKIAFDPVTDGRYALAGLSAHFFGQPGE